MPRFGHLPHDQDPERAQLVQAYMVLRSQQTSVQRRLSSPPPESPSSSPSASPKTGPMDYDADGDMSLVSSVRRRSSPSHSPSASPKPRSQRTTFLSRPSVPPIPEHPESERRVGSDEEKLDSINMRIKATLTGLLNCESVRHDERMRTWVQSRLMDAQQTTNSRRRHSYNAFYRSTTNHASANAAHTPAYPYGVRADRVSAGEHVRKLSI